MRQQRKGRRPNNGKQRMASPQTPPHPAPQGMWAKTLENISALAGSFAWFVAILVTAVALGQALDYIEAHKLLPPEQCKALFWLDQVLFWGDFTSFAWAAACHWFDQFRK